MSYTAKIDVLELLIEILSDHEKRLDKLVARMELLVEYLEGAGSVPHVDHGGDMSLVDAIKDVE